MILRPCWVWLGQPVLMNFGLIQYRPFKNQLKGIRIIITGPEAGARVGFDQGRHTRRTLPKPMLESSVFSV